MKVLRGILLALLGGVLIGCDGSKEPSVASSRSVFDVPAEMVLVQVGDRPITAGDFCRRVAFETSVYRYCLETAGKVSLKDFQKKLEKFENRRIQAVLPALVREALIDSYLVRACGGCSVEGEEESIRGTVAGIGETARNPKLTLADILRVSGCDEAYVRNAFLAGRRERKALKNVDPGYDQVSEDEIQAGFARLDAYTAMAVASNRVTWATASNVLAQVKGGLDFAAAGEKYGEMANEAKEWGEFTRDEIENKGLRAWAFSAKVGEIGGPFDIEDGLSIVKVVSHTVGSEKESMVSLQAEEVLLARINFPMVEEHPEPRERNFCRNAILRRKHADASKKLLEKLYDETKLSYPNGDTIELRRTVK